MTMILHLLVAFSFAEISCAFAFTIATTSEYRHQTTSSSPRTGGTAIQSTSDINDRNIQEGRVQNITQWLTWSDESLKRLSDDGEGGLYDRINNMLQHSSAGNRSYTRITTPQQIHSSERFAVLSHGNQTDPIYNYINSAGVIVFRWPEERYYKLPSRYSAPEGAIREARENEIESTVAKDVTYIDEAVRVRYPDDTVTLRNAILWNVYDDDGNRVGQTVLFDETLCSYSDACTS